MKILVAVAILAVVVLADSATIEKRQARLNGNSNTAQKCPFANTQETPCAKNRSPCNQCNNCENIERTPCEIREAEYRETQSRQQSSKTDTNSANNVNVHSNSANTNPVENRVQVNLVNTVNNINNISNPIEITNINHFFYNGSISSTKNCQNGGPCRQQIEQVQNQQTSCPNSRIRAPIVLPPYIPPPPPCFRMQQFPYIGCQQQPAPYVTSNCASCFYCGGQYNPGFCSSQPACNPGCSGLRCGGGPCYPQLQPCSKNQAAPVVANVTV